jgi:hypothetical protein
MNPRIQRNDAEPGRQTGVHELRTFHEHEAPMATAKNAPQEQDHASENPKMNPDGSGASNQIKNPDDWVSGGEPMTGAQASYLKTLSEQAHAPEKFDPDLDKADASKRIDELKQATAR